MADPAVQQFLDTFLTAPKGKSPDAIQARIIYWIERANHPELYTADTSRFALADARRKARQNVKRLVGQYPGIAAQLAAEKGQSENILAESPTAETEPDK